MEGSLFMMGDVGDVVGVLHQQVGGAQIRHVGTLHATPPTLHLLGFCGGTV